MSNLIQNILHQAHNLELSALKAATKQLAVYGNEETLNILLDALMQRLPSSEFVLFINSIH